MPCSFQSLLVCKYVSLASSAVLVRENTAPTFSPLSWPSQVPQHCIFSLSTFLHFAWSTWNVCPQGFPVTWTLGISLQMLLNNFKKGDASVYLPRSFRQCPVPSMPIFHYLVRNNDKIIRENKETEKDARRVQIIFLPTFKQK